MRGEPFPLTGRGIGVLCEWADGGGEMRIGSAVTVSIPGEGEDVEERATVEAARVGPPEMELPALLFRLPPGSEREAVLRRLLRPGVTLSIAAAAG